jgi:hypothetical protein
MSEWLCRLFGWVCGLFRRRPLPLPTAEPILTKDTSPTEARSDAMMAEARRIRQKSERLRREFPLPDVLYPAERHKGTNA